MLKRYKRVKNSFQYSKQLRFNYFHIVSCIILTIGIQLQSHSIKANETQLPLSHEEYEWLKAHRKIKFSIDDQYPPFNYRDPSGKMIGLTMDYAHLLEKKIGVEFEFKASTWNTAVEKAIRGETDGVLHINITPNESEYLNFTNAFFVSPFSVITLTNVDPLKSLLELEGKKVAIKKKNSGIDFFKQYYPKVEIVETDSFLEALKLVSDKKVFAAFEETAVAQYEMETYLLTNLKPTFILFDNNIGHTRIGIVKTAPELVRILNKAIDAITVDEHRQIRAKWFNRATWAMLHKRGVNASAGNTHGIRDDITVSLSPKEREWLETHPKIRLGFSESYEPGLIVREDGSFTGVLVDFLQKLNQRLETDIQISLSPWSELPAKVKDRSIDGILGLTSAKANLLDLATTNSYLTAFPSVYVRTDASFTVTQLSDLTGKTVVIIDGSHRSKLLLKPYLNRITIIRAPSARDALELVYAGKADAMLGLTSHNYLTVKYMLSSVVPAYVSWDAPEHIVMGIRSDYQELVSIINKGIASFSKKEIDALVSKWIMLPKQSSGLKLTASEKVWLSTHPVIRVGADPNWAPVEFKDEDGKYKGICIDYLKRMEQLLGIKFEIDQQSSWQELIYKSKRREVDLFSCVTQTEERFSYLNFTQPYLSFPIVVFVRQEKGYVNDLKQLEGQKVAVVEGYAIHDLLKNNYPNLDLVPVKNNYEALLRLSRRDVSAFIGNLLTTTHAISKHGFTDLKVGGETSYKNDLSVGVRKDWPELVSIMQKAIDSIENGEKKSFQRKWTSMTYEHKFDYSIIWKVLVAVAVILTFLFLWIQRLAKEIRMRKMAQAELACYQEQLEQLVNERTQALQNEMNQHMIAIREKTLLESQLRQTQKIESIGLLAGGIAHDFNNILSPILTYTQMALDKTPSDSKNAFYLQQVRKGASRAAELVKQILTFSRRADQKLEPIRIQLIVKEALKLLRSSIPSTIEIKQEMSTEYGTVLADPTQIHQIVINLCTNAYHAMKERGGVLGVRVKLITVTKDNLPDKTNLDPGTYEKIEISDTGTGMTNEVIEKMFEPYYTTKTPEEGTGLGLSVVHGIVTNLRGKIAVQSAPGKGTTFTIYLPTVDKNSTAEDTTDTVPSARGSEKILLIDDEEIIGNMYKEVFENLGYQVTVFTRSQDALKHFMNNPDAYDLIITDMTMPNLTGEALASQILSFKPNFPVILYTGYSDQVNEKRARSMGIRAFLKKPVNLHQLTTTVRSILDDQHTP